MAHCQALKFNLNFAFRLVALGVFECCLAGTCDILFVAPTWLWRVSHRNYSVVAGGG